MSYMLEKSEMNWLPVKKFETSAWNAITVLF